MKSKISIFSFLFIFTSSWAQSNLITGKVIDKLSNEAIEYATVSIYSIKDSSLVDGTVTNELGRFEMKNLPKGELYLTAQFLGYEVFQSPNFTTNSSKDFGAISLGLNSTTLSEVEVAGRAVTSLHKLDKQVFDAAQFKNARGGTASDVLSNLPSVSVNSFGEIAVRGNTGFLLMLNGKVIQGAPTALLQQIAANTIEDIEIITAPSAKYDPDGNAGIINIKTKQGSSDGSYLLANALIGLPSVQPYDNTNSTPRYGADLTYNYRKEEWDISLGLDYRRYDISGRREGYVNTYLNEILTEFPSDGERSFDETNYSARMSARYSPSKKQRISAGFYAGKRNKERTADILYKNQQRSFIARDQFLEPEAYYNNYLSSNNVFTSGAVQNTLTYFNENLRVRKGDFLIGSLDYEVQLGNESSLKLSALYERTILGGPTDNANLDWPNTSNIFQLQFNDNNNPLDGVRLQLDFKKQLGTVSWETGYQFRFLKHPGDFEYFDRDLDNNTWVENPLFTNSIELRRAIHSVYSQWSGEKKRLQYSAGLRLEYFDRTVEIARPDNTFELDRFNLFPSANLSYDLNSELLFKAGYSRRIARTTTFKMTPFPEREHSETLEQGDAELLPEYIDLAEAGLVKNWKDNSAFVTLYYRHTKNVINRVNSVFNDTILNRIYTNVGDAEALGLEFGTQLYPTKWWSIYLGANIFNYNIEGQLFGDVINTSNTIFSINANTNFRFSPTFKMQLALNYLSERITAQGRDSRFYNPSRLRTMCMKWIFSN